MSDDMVRCSSCGTPHGSIEDATVCCEKDKPGVVGPKVKPKRVRRVVKLRPAVKRFAEAMELVLRDNDHKTGWQELCNDHLVERMEDELGELHVELFHIADYREPNIPDIARAVHEAIDLANFAMMFFENNRDHYEKGADE